jgi:predicted ATPase
MLSRIHLHNDNCFVNFELALSQRLLIVGSNGSGKSSLWEALAGIQGVAVRGHEVSDAFPTRA